MPGVAKHFFKNVVLFLGLCVSFLLSMCADGGPTYSPCYGPAYLPEHRAWHNYQSDSLILFFNEVGDSCYMKVINTSQRCDCHEVQPLEKTGPDGKTIYYTATVAQTSLGIDKYEIDISSTYDTMGVLHTPQPF